MLFSFLLNLATLAHSDLRDDLGGGWEGFRKRPTWSLLHSCPNCSEAVTDPPIHHCTLAYAPVPINLPHFPPQFVTI